MRLRSLLALPALAGLTLLATRVVPGRLRDGSTLLPSGWRVRPAGRTVSVGTLPLGLVTLSDGSLMVANNGYSPNGLMRIDPVKGTVVWDKTLPAWLGLARSGSEWRDTVWVSGAGTNRVYRLTWQGGMAWTLDSVALAETNARVFPGGIALVPRRGLVAVVGNQSDSVYFIDAATLARRGSAAVGRRPYGAVADSAHLYVSDWGDSTVSAFDLSASPPVRLTAIHVGPHPSALALRGADLYVALAGANAVARVDLRTGSVVEQLAVALSPNAPTGSDPNALALSPDGRTLYVAMAGNNAVAVVRIGRSGMRVAGLIPAGWYPTAVATSADGRTLFVVNGKGNGSGANRDGTYIGNVITGSVSIVPVPDDATLARYTREAYALSPYSNPALRPTVRPSDRPTQVKHVVYIIRENRTYDQVLGDVRGANGDPALAIFNDSITPNAHAIAHRWVLFDNFYVDGEVSADGHEWSDRAFAGDYNEKTWPQIYGHRRNWDLDDGDDLVNPHGAYLWDAARRKGLWVVNFGERAETDSGPGGSTHTKLAGLDSITVPSYPAFRLEIRDTTRARLFGDSVASWDRQGRFPDLVFLWLPRDHTYGRDGGRPTPRSMVADNDLALGQVIERLSLSAAWSSLAVFVLEDDAQNGPDHVDAHRSVLLVASPYAKRGVVDSTFYTTSSVVRSIGQLLGLPPLSQYDSAATPLWNAFASRVDSTPFAVLPNTWSLDEMNPAAYRSPIPPGDFAVADRADEVLLNREIWESVHPRTAAPPVRRAWVVREPGR
jgi:DNA-binding beta-propeller fold protein YncE